MKTVSCIKSVINFRKWCSTGSLIICRYSCIMTSSSCITIGVACDNISNNDVDVEDMAHVALIRANLRDLSTFIWSLSFATQHTGVVGRLLFENQRYLHLSLGSMCSQKALMFSTIGSYKYLSSFFIKLIVMWIICMISEPIKTLFEYERVLDSSNSLRENIVFFGLRSLAYLFIIIMTNTEAHKVIFSI